VRTSEEVDGTTYSLSSLYLEDAVEIPLNEARYREILHARQALVDVGFYEESFELLVGNYKAFELFCVARSLDSRIGGDYRIEPASNVISEANRLLTNFLTSVRSYTDQTRSAFKTTNAGSEFRAHVKSKLEGLRTSSESFPLLEVVRNYAQHVGMPVDSIQSNWSHDSHWSEGAIPYVAGDTIAPSASSNRKRTVDLTTRLPPKVNLRALCYSVLRELSALHCTARKIVEKDCARARGLLESAIQEVDASLHDNQEAQAKMRPARLRRKVVHRHEVQVLEHTLMLDWDDVRKARAAKHARAVSDFKNSPLST
jgi:hypothetical protein